MRSTRCSTAQEIKRDSTPFLVSSNGHEVRIEVRCDWMIFISARSWEAGEVLFEQHSPVIAQVGTAASCEQSSTTDRLRRGASFGRQAAARADAAPTGPHHGTRPLARHVVAPTDASCPVQATPGLSRRRAAVLASRQTLKWYSTVVLDRGSRLKASTT